MGTRKRWQVGTALAAGLLLVGAAAEATAGTIEFESGTRYELPWNGGSYKVKASSGIGDVSGSSGWETFCVEANEIIRFGVTFDATVEDFASLGGVGGAVSGKDSLDPDAAYLYTGYRTGTLTTSTTMSQKSANVALQLAIWWIEEEISRSGDGPEADIQDYVDDNYGTLSVDSGDSLDEIVDQAADWVDDAVDAGWDDIGSVRVVNSTLTSETDGSVTHYQSVLTLVPLPPAAYLGAALLGGMAFSRLRRRRRNANAS